MGGGDLNMKKSFHPHTMQNLERVWKAEQKRDQERKKIDQLRRELHEERAREEMHRHAVETGVIKDRGERLDWMYSGPGATVNHEEYLLGKKIDKAVDPFAAQPETDSSSTTPGSMFTSSLGANSTVDLAAKIKEDPLFMMKKQEEQARKNLLRNPVRLKQLQEMLREQTSDKSNREDKSKKKKKKKHKRGHSTDSGEERVHHDAMVSRRHSARSVRRSRSPDRYRGAHESGSGSSFHDYRRESSSRSHSSRYDRGRSRSRSHSRSRSPVQRSAGRHHGCHHRSKSRSPLRYSSTSSRRRQRSPPRRRLDPQELERRRQQMVEDARTHDKERLDRIKRRREQAEREELELRAREASTDEQFIAPIRANALKGAAGSTVEDRIHRNINKIQRTKASLDKNFTQR